MDTARAKARILVALVATVAATLGMAPAQATTHPRVRIADGRTQPAFSYADAIRETVYVQSSVDSGGTGSNDKIAVDIIRPKETDSGLKVPVIMDASPYYQHIGRGNETQVKKYDAQGNPIDFPLYYDNYFVPRGYAVVQPDMAGTNRSTGCPDTGGPGDVQGIKAVIDWLGGRAQAVNRDGAQVTASWTTDKIAMIGKSYDGTLAEGVAATGVAGLTTIVPISAISSWYDYYRSSGGVVYSPDGPAGLSADVTADSLKDACAGKRSEMSGATDDATGDYNDFWAQRDYMKTVDQVKASVFLVHGLNDLNVKTKNFGQFWDAIAARGVPRKIWLSQLGHVDPFDYRRDVWVPTIQRWFDYWLMGVKNGVMDDPQADVEVAANQWKTYTSWPDPAATQVTAQFGPASGDAPGTLTLPGKLAPAATQSFTDDTAQNENTMAGDETTARQNRLVYLTSALPADVRLSGTATARIAASVDQPDTHLTVLLVDYGDDTRVDYKAGTDGSTTLGTSSCFGDSTADDSACYKDVGTLTANAPFDIVTRGWLDAAHNDSLTSQTMLTPGQEYAFHWTLAPQDYVFKAGHRIGVVVAGSDPDNTVTDTNNATVTVNLDRSSVQLPLVPSQAGARPWR
jgi:X-Pro dipeptidyl-peptidase